MHKKDKALRVPGFLRALGFTAGNRRKKTYYMDVGRYMEEQIESTACTETAAANRAAKAFKISRKTASGQFKEYLGNRIGLDAPLSEAEKILVPK